jgi:hypothetical protein
MTMAARVPTCGSLCSRRITRAKATSRPALRSTLLLRRKVLDQYSRFCGLYSRSLQNAFDVNPLARHSATRTDHSAAFDMRTRLKGGQTLSYTAP